MKHCKRTALAVALSFIACGSALGADAYPNRPVQLVREAEPTAHGVALLLAYAVDGSALSDYKPVSARTFMPQPEDVARMKAAGERQANLYHRLYDVDLG